MIVTMLEPAIQPLAIAAIQQSLMELLAVMAMDALKQIHVKVEPAVVRIQLFAQNPVNVTMLAPAIQPLECAAIHL
jgi:hypothetical protein